MRNVVISVVFLVVLSITGVAQVQSIAPKAERSAQSRIESTQGLVDPPTMFKAIQKGTAAVSESKGENFGPGDIPTFLLHCSGQYVHRGESVECDLVSMVLSRESYFVIGRIFRPGTSGYYDGTYPVGYFSSDTGNGLLHGADPGEFIKVHTRTFGTDENPGWYQMDVIVYDYNGNLVQQLWMNFYLIDSGPVTQTYHIDTAVPNGDAYRLSGQFPINTPIFYMVGVPKWGYSVTGPNPAYAAYSTMNGRRLDLPARLRFTNQTRLDIATWSPGSRQAIIGNNIIVEPAVGP